MRIVMLAAAALAAFAVTASAQTAPWRIERGALRVENVPETPPDVAERLRQYVNTRSAGFADWLPGGGVLITTRFAEATQVHEVRTPMGARTQLTFHGEPVMGSSYRPNDPDRIVYGINEGGAENYQIFLLDRTTGKARRFTDGKSRNLSLSWSPDGKLAAYSNNRRNGRDFDVYVVDPADPGSERKVAEEKAAETGKPADVQAKMVDGAIKKYAKDNALLSQLSVFDNKTPIADFVAQAGKAAGASIVLKDYVRFQLGEGIEKEASDFAAEVAAAVAG